MMMMTIIAITNNNQLVINYFVFNFCSLPRNGLHLRLDVGCCDSFGIESLFGRSYRIVHLRLQPTRTFWNRLGMGWLLRQHPIWREILARIRRRRWKGSRHSNNLQPTQQRSWPSGKSHNINKLWSTSPPPCQSGGSMITRVSQFWTLAYGWSGIGSLKSPQKDTLVQQIFLFY